MFVFFYKRENAILGRISPALIRFIIPLRYVLLALSLVIINLKLETDHISCFGRQGL